ncbi:MAG: lytic transglycosylase domain-containing protein [Planctomycetota bacterium]
MDKTKNRSLKILALWWLSAIMILSTIALSPYNSQMDLPNNNEIVSLHRPMIPSLFPDKVLGFDPVKALVTAQQQDPDHLFDLIIHEASRRHRVDSAMVRAIILAESRYNIYAISSKGARGLMQLMPVTAKELGVANSFNPVQNINAGVKYFKILLNRFDGDVKLSLAAYNAGIGRVLKYNGVPPYKETGDYVKKVLHYHRFYKAHDHGDNILRWQYLYWK